MDVSALAEFLNLLPFPACVVSVSSATLVQWNTALTNACGAPTARTLPALFHRPDSDGARRIVDAIRTGTPIADADATLCYSLADVTVAVQPIAIERHAAAALVLCYPTARWAHTRRGLRRDHERLEIALAAGRLGSWEFDVSTRRLTCTAACKANHGFRPDDDMQLQPHLVDAVYPEHRGRFVDAIDTAIATNGSFEIEVPNTWPDGTDHWLLVAGRMVDETTMVGVSQDITDRRRTEQALRDSELQHRTLVEAANEGIWRLDQNARVTFVNQRMADLLKMSPAAMLGRHKWDFVFEDDVALMRDLFHRRQQGIAEDVADIRFRRADGREVWTLMAARPLYDAEGRFTGAVDLFTDITERRRAEQALRESDRRKDEFLAVLAHELRGPLAPIITAVKLLQAKGPPEPALQRLRDTIYRQTMQLRTLVDDLLDVGRITAGKLRLDRTTLDLRAIVQQSVEVSASLIERRRHTLQVRLPDHPVYVEGDAARLVQVATNLLNNAARYTPEGGRIDISLHAEGEHAVVTVRDYGVGIPPEMLERIFDRFVQVGRSAAGTEGGLGIGLSVVKALIDLHGGAVDARSDGIGKGSEFSFRLRLASVAAAHAI